MKRVLLALLLLLLPFGCAQPNQNYSNKTTVCVENDREHSMRVEIRDASTNAQYGELWMHSFEDVCEEMSIPPSATLRGVIKSVSVRYDVSPPAWRDMLRSDYMILVVGGDGLTPFAHSGRIR